MHFKSCVPNHVHMCCDSVRLSCIISGTVYKFIHNAKWRSNPVLTPTNELNESHLNKVFTLKSIPTVATNEGENVSSQ